MDRFNDNYTTEEILSNWMIFLPCLFVNMKQTLTIMLKNMGGTKNKYSKI